MGKTLPQEEFDGRIARLAKRVAEAGLDAERSPPRPAPGRSPACNRLDTCQERMPARTPRM